MRRVLLRIGDFIFVMRPLILIPAWSFYLLGMRAGRIEAHGEPPVGGVVTGFACLSAILITAYLLNQVFDRESDRLNEKGHYLTRGLFSVRTVVLMSVAFFALATVTFRNAAPLQRIPLAAALIISLAYSLPPIRLCARPFVDLAANAVGYGGLAFVIGFVSRSDTILASWMRSVPWIFMVGATFLHTTILDVDGDSKSGKITTSVKIGVGWSALLSLFLSAAGTGWAWAVSWNSRGDFLSPVVLTISLIAFFYAYIRIRPLCSSSADASPGELHRISSNAVQLATLTATGAAVMFVPLYLIVLVPLVILSRVYYRARFGLQYPGPAAPARNA